MRKVAIILLGVSGVFAQYAETIATGWSKLDSITTHSGSPYNVVVTDEVSAGWDLDQDGNAEFLVLTDHSNPNGGGPEYATGASLWLYEANASGGFDLAWSWWDTTLYTGGASFPVHTVADLDGDGNDEILLGIPYGTGNPPDGSNPIRFYVWEGGTGGLPAWSGTTAPTPTATWDFGASVGTNTRPSGMSVGDFDGDQTQEVAVGFRAFSDAATDDAVIIFSLNGDFAGTFTQWTEEHIDTTTGFNSIYAITTCDADGDGMSEAFVSSFSYDKGYFIEGSGTADDYNMYTIVGDPNWLGGIHSVAAYDVDGDGADEVFVGNGSQTNVVVIDDVTDLATADSSNVTAILSNGVGFRGLTVGDFDGDGNVDIFSGDNYNGSSTHWEYDGSGAVSDTLNWSAGEMIYQQDTSGSIRVYSVAFGGASNNGGSSADLNGDSYPDLVIGFEDGDSTATSYVIVLSSSDVLAISNNYGAAVLDAYKLSQNYPNPFNPTTSINVSLSKAGRVELKVYDLMGRVVNTLVSDYRPAGEFSVQWNGQDKKGRQVASGMYLYKLQVNGAILTRTMTLVK